jgi:hypothetical protein
LKIINKAFAVIFLFTVTTAAVADKDYYFTLNYSRSRAVGMGVAFTAVTGGLESAFYNPASFQYILPNKGVHFTLLFNPIVSAGLYDFYSQSSRVSTNAWLDIIKTLPKAALISIKNWEIGFINHEELETRQDSHPNLKFFEGDHFLQHHMENFVVRVRLAEQVQIGGSVQYYSVWMADSLQHGFGTSYGIFVHPHPKMNVGIVFISLPTKMKSVRLNYDRFESETVNVGLAYQPFSATTLALDVRNLSEDSQQTTRELHVGVEQGFWGHIFLRSGFYQDQWTKNSRLSFGLGLLNLDLFRFDELKSASPNLAINYALVIQPNTDDRWHFLSFQWGFGW